MTEVSDTGPQPGLFTEWRRPRTLTFALLLGWTACLILGMWLIRVAPAVGLTLLWPASAVQFLLLRAAGRWRYEAAAAVATTGFVIAASAALATGSAAMLAALNVVETLAILVALDGRGANALRDMRQLVRGALCIAAICAVTGAAAAFAFESGAVALAYAAIWAVVRATGLIVWLPLLAYRETDAPPIYSRDLRMAAIAGIAAVPVVLAAGPWLRLDTALLAALLMPSVFLALAVYGMRGALGAVVLMLVVGFHVLMLRAPGSLDALLTFQMFAAGLVLSLLIMRGTLARMTAEAPVLDAISAQVQEAVVRLDDGGAILSANPAFAALTGGAGDAVLGRPLASFVDADHRDALETAIRSLAAGEPGVALELVLASADLEPQWIELVLARLPDAAVGQGRIGGAMRDISVRRRHSEALDKARRVLEIEVERDPLTNLANRRLFHRRLDQGIADAEATGGRLALVLFDVDHFKQINDALGHGTGDEVLRRLGELARGVTRSHDLVARLGGDEFAMILPGTTAQIAAKVSTRLLARIAAGFDDVAADVSISLGVSDFQAGATAAGLMDAADRALYRAKAAGRATVIVDK